MKVYVASSWRNEQQPAVVERLRNAGHEVYDFRNPPDGGKGFAWSEIDPNWKNWTADEYLAALKHRLAKAGYRSDMGGLEWADACVIVHPCGVASALEFGYAVGSHMLTIALVYSVREPDLMLAMADFIVTSRSEVVDILRAADRDGRPCTQ